MSLRDIAIEAAQAGVDAIRAVLAAGPLDVATKSSHRDLVTAADRESERAVLAVLRAHRPDDTVVGEESGTHPGTSDVTWYVDPVDGTTNFVHSHPNHAVSVGARRDGIPAAGIVLRPAMPDDWLAWGGEGYAGPLATRVGVPDRTDPADALVGIGFAQKPEYRARMAPFIGALMPEIRDFRRHGSAAGDLLWIATGALDAFIGFDQRPWDVAGGEALLHAAGGVGRTVRLADDLTATAYGNPALAEALAERVVTLFPF